MLEQDSAYCPTTLSPWLQVPGLRYCSPVSRLPPREWNFSEYSQEHVAALPRRLGAGCRVEGVPHNSRAMDEVDGLAQRYAAEGMEIAAGDL